MMWKRIDGMRTLGLGPPGPFRDELNALVLEGKKTATAGVWRVDYEPDGEDVEAVGERLVLLDSDGRRSGVVEVTRVESHRFADVPWELARDEGEGFTSIEDLLKPEFKGQLAIPYPINLTGLFIVSCAIQRTEPLPPALMPTPRAKRV